MARSSKGVIVLGMHRAGTSATGHILVDLGFELPGEPVPADSDNPEGYWEPREIVEIHDDFLQEIDRSWSDTRPLDRSVFEGQPAAAARERLRDVVQGQMLPHKQWVLKDPRMCRLMPLWEGLLEAQGLKFRFLHVLRSPLAVAESLRKRDSFRQEKSFVLWLRHNLEAEAATRGQERCWLHFEQLAGGSETLVNQRIRAAIGSAQLSSERIQSAVRSVLDPSLVHYHHDFDQSLERLADFPWIASAYEAFGSLVANGDQAAEATLDRLRADILKADTLRLGDPAVWEAELTGERFYLLRRSIETQRKEIATQRAEVDALREVFKGEREEAARMRQKLAEHQRSAEERYAELISRQKDEAEQRQMLAKSLSGDSARGIQQLEALRESLNGIAEHLDASEEQRHRLETSLGAVDAHVRQLESLRESLNSVAQHQAASAEQRQGLVASLSSMDSQVQQLENLRECLAQIAERQVTVAEEQRRRLVETLTGLDARGRQLDDLKAVLGEIVQGQALAAKERLQLKQSAEGQDSSLKSISSGVSEIERLLAERLEKRHLALLGKSLEVSARLEFQWVSARQQLEEVTRERDASMLEQTRIAQERDAALEGRDAALRERDAALEQHDARLRERDAERRQQQEAFELERRRLLGEVERARRERNDAQAEIAQLLQRASWRITAPLRLIMKTLKGRPS